MSSPQRREEEADVAVVGGGIVGLSIAFRAQQRGLRTVVLERHRAGAGASGVAAGMLAPVSEAEVGHAELLADGLEAARAWPAFARELDVELHTAGTLIVARDRDEAEALDRERAFREKLGLRVERLLPSAARRLEPALAPNVRLALHVPDDRAVDPRAVLDALRARVRVERTEVPSLDDVEAATVVLAAGAWSAQLADVPVRPVKGQIMRLRDPAHDPRAPLVARVLRFEGGYLVPRGDGRYVLGATMEDKGFDTTVTAGGLYELLRDAGEVVPGVSELVIEESGAGLRPGTPGNVPIVERRGRVVVATGHFRNGILLAPVTARQVVEQLTASEVPA
ncbi:MAG TPA: glycine oxidase ThiO [Solirubrobacteraceae bacterium]|nr:glycine oxidase ThiO [Solirubrobacteraceae bacterium]